MKRGFVPTTAEGWERSGWLFFAVLAVVHLAIHAFSIMRGPDHVATALFQDDTFYFLQTAWNAHHFGFVTFDGINPTNGVQFLWWIVVWLIAWPLQSKAALVMGVAGVCAILNVAGYFVIYKIGRELEQPGLALSASVLWFSLTLASPTYIRGMDISLHGFVFWCVVWQLARFVVRHTLGQSPSLLPITVVLILNVWTRIDSALVSGAIFGCCAALTLWDTKKLETTGSEPTTQARLKGVAIAAAFAAAGGLVQILAFRLMDRSVIPVSALWKSPRFLPSSHERFGDAFVSMIWRGFVDLGLPRVSLKPGMAAVVSVVLIFLMIWLCRRDTASRWTSPVAAVVLFVLGVVSLLGAWIPEMYLAVVGVLVILWLRWAESDSTKRSLFLTWATLTTAFLTYNAGAILLGMRPRYYSAWYQAPAHIFWIVTCWLAVYTVVVSARHHAVRRGFRIGGVALLGVVLVSGLVRGIRGYPPNAKFVGSLRMARGIAATETGGSIFAAWNAGLLGYYCERKLVNLDGLVNSVEYLKQREETDFRMIDYLHAENIEYVVDWTIPEEVRPYLTPISKSPTKPGWVPIVLYRVN